jgi:hypothetical protein
MINESALRDTLLAIVNDSKTLYLMISALNDEIAAMRETVQGLDPTFSDVMAVRMKEIEKQKAPIVQAATDLYDEIFQRVRDGYVC